MLSESLVSKAILERYFTKLHNSLCVDVAIAGAGPSGITAAYYLASKGLSVTVFEKKLSPGGGIWGGGMLFNEIVIDSGACHILDELGVEYHQFDDVYTADSVEVTAALIYRARKAGAVFFNTMLVEDVIVKQGCVKGFVVNWTPVEMTGLHVDPISVEAKVCLEATGHPLEILSVLERKNDIRLNTETGRIMGERSMHAEIAEKLVVESTSQIFPGLFVSGMAASAAHGAPRMGPVFGGMLRSGKKVADLIINEFEEQKRELEGM